MIYDKNIKEEYGRCFLMIRTNKFKMRGRNDEDKMNRIHVYIQK